jgi:hypothetical protein
MAFNSVGQYTGNFKTWDHLGNIMPNVEHSEGERPAGEFKPAAWLPVKFFDKYFEDWIVVTPGKVLCFDNDGKVVPAQYATSGNNIVYTANDVAQGVIDVRTGVALLTANIGTFAVSTVANFMGRTGEAMACSKPVGVAPYAYKQWAGGDGSNPTQLRLHNYNMQSQVAILCDYVLTLPLVPNSVSAEVVTWGAPSANVSTGSALAHLPVAKNTVRTPITFTGTDAALFVNQVDTAALVKASGDWNINYSTGVIKVFKTTGSGAPVASVTYSTYDTSGTTAVTSEFACAKGNLKAGQFVKVDADGNYVVDASPSLDNTVGQVLEVVDFPRAGLEKVRTAFTPPINTSAAGSKPGYAGQMDQLPGSATGGVPDAVAFSGAANLMVRINLISR